MGVGGLSALSAQLTLLDGDGSEGAVEIASFLVGEGRLLDVDLGAVDLGIGVGGHGFLWG